MELCGLRSRWPCVGAALLFPRHGSCLSEDGIEGPAATDMRPVTSAMDQNALLSPPSFFKGICQDRQCVECPAVVKRPRDRGSSRAAPVWVCWYGTKGVWHDVPQ